MWDGNNIIWGGYAVTTRKTIVQLQCHPGLRRLTAEPTKTAKVYMHNQKESKKKKICLAYKIVKIAIWGDMGFGERLEGGADDDWIECVMVGSGDTACRPNRKIYCIIHMIKTDKTQRENGCPLIYQIFFLAFSEWMQWTLAGHVCMCHIKLFIIPIVRFPLLSFLLYIRSILYIYSPTSTCAAAIYLYIVKFWMRSFTANNTIYIPTLWCLVYGVAGLSGYAHDFTSGYWHF